MGEIVDFIFDHGGEYYNKFDREDMQKAIDIHLKVGTIYTDKDANGLKIMIRWNESKDGYAHVLDTVVRDDCRSFKHILKAMDLASKNRPHIHSLIVGRDAKYPGRTHKIYNLKKIIKER